MIYQQATGTFTRPVGPIRLTVKIPNSYYQIDFVCGTAISQLEPNQNNNAYGPDSANILYHAESRFISARQRRHNGSQSHADAESLAGDAADFHDRRATMLTDSATLSGGYNPTGTITFYLFAPGVTTPNRAPYSNNVYSDTVDGQRQRHVHHGDPGTNPGGYRHRPVPGTYQWVAVYSGDANNNGVTSGYGSEPETVSKASPTITTTPGGTVTCGGLRQADGLGDALGRVQPDRHDHLLPVRTGRDPQRHLQQQRVHRYGHGQRRRHLHHQHGQQPRRLRGDDDRHLPVAGGLQRRYQQQRGLRHLRQRARDRAVQPCAVGSGQYATIGFWQNKNGQAVINSFNGGSTATAAR